MINTIINCLKSKGISEYIITDTHEESVEMFFVRKNLDMRRAKEVHVYLVKVYRTFEKDGQKMKGESEVSVYPNMTAPEIENVISGAYLAASYVANPYFELPKGVKEEKIVMESSLNGASLADNARKMTEALFAEDTREDVFLNSAELFMTQKKVRIVGFNGTDVSYVKRHVEGEFVAQCIKPQDVETYQSFDYDNLELRALRDKVKATLDMTRARALAKEAPAAGKYRVIISGQYMSTMLEFYTDRSSAGMIYPKYSSYEVGTEIQGKEVKGDKLSVELVAKAPYSAEGIPMKNRELLDEGTLKTIHGNARFSYYLGIEATGAYSAVKVAPGKVSLDDMKREPYLHIVNFSDFQMDSFSGHFGGEIRLAFLYDGKTVTPVTGGSINGSIIELQNNLCLSSDMQVEGGYEGPLAMCLENVSVAGL